MYAQEVPKLWTATIEQHRTEVRAAILLAAGSLVQESGFLALSMSQLAERAGIGRATLYKYFPDVESVLVAWHEDVVAGHLEALTAMADGDAPASQRLLALTTAYAQICHGRTRHGSSQVRDVVHQAATLSPAEHELHAIFKKVIVQAAETGHVRRDVPPAELAAFCIHALEAAQHANKPGVARLVALVQDALIE